MQSLDICRIVREIIVLETDKFVEMSLIYPCKGLCICRVLHEIIMQKDRKNCKIVLTVIMQENRRFIELCVK